MRVRDDFEWQIAFRTSSISQMIFRPIHGHAEKSGESRNVDKAFDPLHGPSKHGARIRSGMAGLQYSRFTSA
jgi:hypothetical protein